MATSDDLRFQCYLLDNPEDFHLMQRASDLEMLDDKILNHSLTSLFENLRFEDAFDYRDHFFILWDAKKKDVIGYAELDVDNDMNVAEFSSSYIVRDMRKRGLSKLLFDARFEKLDELNFNGIVRTRIALSNAPCWERAKGYGFERNENSQCEMTYANGNFKPNQKLLSEACIIVEQPDQPALDYQAV